MTDEDFAATRVEGQHTIELEGFVPYDEIDPTFCSHTSLVEPGAGAERPYALPARAMEEPGLVEALRRSLEHAEREKGCRPARRRRAR